jgi:ribokinase
VIPFCRAPPAGPDPARRPGGTALIGGASVDEVWEASDGYGRKYLATPHRRRGGFVRWAAEQLAALSLPGTILSAVGPDAEGAFFVDDTRAAGLPVAGIRVVSAPTRLARVVVRQGERTIFAEQGVHARWGPTAADEPLLRACSVWCLGGTLDEPGPDDPVLHRTLHLGRACGKTVALNPTRLNHLGRLDLSGTSLVQVSEDDWPALGFSARAGAAEVAEAFLRQGCPLVIVTAGERGARAFTAGGEAVVMPAIAVPTPRYPVGVGDSVFVVHVWALLLEHFDLYTACNYGSAAGAHRIATGRPASAVTIETLAQASPPGSAGGRWPECPPRPRKYAGPTRIARTRFSGETMYADLISLRTELLSRHTPRERAQARGRLGWFTRKVIRRTLAPGVDLSEAIRRLLGARRPGRALAPDAVQAVGAVLVHAAFDEFRAACPAPPGLAGRAYDLFSREDGPPTRT